MLVLEEKIKVKSKIKELIPSVKIQINQNSNILNQLIQNFIKYYFY